MDEILDKFEEIKKIIDKKSKKNFKEKKEEIKKETNKLIDDSKEVMWCVTDKGVIAGGTAYDILTAICVGIARMSKDRHIPKKLVFEMLESAFEIEDEEDDTEEDMFKEIKKMVEEW